MKKKLLLAGGIGLVLFAIISDPIASSESVQSVLDFFRDAGESGQQFANTVIREQ